MATTKENILQEEKNEKVFNPLVNKKVFVKPIIRSGKWLSKEHSGGFMYDGTAIKITLPLDRLTGTIKNPLTKEEQEFFENIKYTSKHGFNFEPGDLSTKKKVDNYWKNYSVTLRKQQTGPMTEDDILMTLDLSDADQYIKSRVLAASPLVAPNIESKYNSGKYKLVLVEEGEQDKAILTKAIKLRDVNKFFYSIDNSPTKMYEFLYIFWLENSNFNQPPVNEKTEWYISEIQKLIDNRLDEVYDLVIDKDTYPAKVMIQQAIKIGALRYNRHDGIETADGIPIGNNLEQAMRFLKDDKNQDIFIKIKNQIEINK